MQQRTLLVVLALLAAPVALAASPASFLQSTLSAASQARLFLQNHAGKPVQQDELAELKGVNPDAYALVKALLTKRSLGLLNSKNPTASFVPGVSNRPLRQQAAEQGSKVFSSMLHPGELEAFHEHRESLVSQAESQAAKVVLPYASVEPAHHDWMKWNGGDDHDDQMVQNVLGAASVSELLPRSAWSPDERRPETGLLSMESDDESPPPASATKQNGFRISEDVRALDDTKQNGFLKAKTPLFFDSALTAAKPSFSVVSPPALPKAKATAMSPAASDDSYQNRVAAWKPEAIIAEEPAISVVSAPALPSVVKYQNPMEKSSAPQDTSYQNRVKAWHPQAITAASSQAPEKKAKKNTKGNLPHVPKPAASPKTTSRLQAPEKTQKPKKTQKTQAPKKKTSQLYTGANNLLADFSFEPKPKVVAKPTPSPKAVAHREAMLAWLGVVKKAPPPQPQVAPVKAPAKPTERVNTYMLDLS